MRQLRPPGRDRRGQHRHQDRPGHVDIPQRQRRPPARVPAEHDEPKRRRHPDGQTKARSRRHRLMDRPPAQGHHHPAETAAADPHHGRQPADHRPGHAPPPAGRQVAPQRDPLRQQPHLRRHDQQADAIDDRQPLHRGEPRDRRPDQRPRRHPRRPGLQHRLIHRPMRPMRPQRPPRGRDDGQQRRPDRRMQIALAPDAEHLEGIEDRRHNHRPAPDPEQPGDETSDQPGRGQGREQQEEVGEGQRAEQRGHGQALAHTEPLSHWERGRGEGLRRLPP